MDEMTPELILSHVGVEDGSGFESREAVRNDPAPRDLPFILIRSTAANDKKRVSGPAPAGGCRFGPIEPSARCEEFDACLAARKHTV